MTAQKDYALGSGYGYTLDSLTLSIFHLRTQNAQQDSTFGKDLRVHVMQYMEIVGDTLYANFPRGYQVYPFDDIRTGKRITDTKLMISVTIQLADGISTIRNFYAYDLVGTRKPICSVKRKAWLQLSL
jgi:hypothetical protein